MAIEKIIATKNIQNVVSDDVTNNTHVDVVMSDAYKASVSNAEHVDGVMQELDEKAEAVITEAPEAPEVKEDTIYTKKQTLDESIEDFELTPSKPTKVYDDDEMDTYWDMDMFGFIYELVSITDTRRKPIDPLGRPHARFAVSGRDKYAGLTDEQKEIEKQQEANIDMDRAMLGSPQVASNDDYIEVYAHNLFRFDDIKKICEIYHFQTEGPTNTYKTKRNKFSMTPRDEWMQYEYSFRIYIPKDSSGLFYRIDDYFETLGLTLEDVMNPDFCKHYRKIEARIQKEAEEMLAKKEKERSKAKAKKDKEAAAQKNDDAVEAVYRKYTEKASWSEDPLENFIKDMFTELDTTTLEDGSKVKYSKTKLRKRFLDDFDDGFEDEE